MKSTCSPCTDKTPQLNKIEISKLLEEVPLYQLFEIEGIKRISRLYTFKNFKKALSFTNEIGRIAEEENHHPELVLEWGKVKVSWWTHSIEGLDTNDFIMAIKSDKLYINMT
ncbi:MAG: 4a-hydroxytetrahydrobiopterin dehydratase [Arcobacter sp.]|nr:MAG: 4a-hydroxytetrahydrobiopterin dehydratase [Arcobacter sp.]